MKPLSQINVIPFIDVMLVLLAVVLTTATFVAQGKIPVSLPGASQAEPLPTGPALEITIDSAGQLYLAEQAVDLDLLAEALTGLGADRQLMLRVDEAAAFRHFVAVVDLLKARGLENVSIVTRREAG
ncbi:MAG: TonB system transport protein ExbD [Chromatiaceae bacterium]|jgi:biopolymer transport protein ExbD|nr:TonB system transport protein ExbD [Chromatiaceae bacterium]